jgi:hypothetical protein
MAAIYEILCIKEVIFKGRAGDGLKRAEEEYFSLNRSFQLDA